ncbi:MAG: DUF480 domain-containing protein [Actinomycetes bacterium]
MDLSPVAQRVLGSLVEKSLATPQQYPLTVNSLVAACNQRSAREPVMDLTDGQVEAGLAELRAVSLVRTVTGGRSLKHEHRVATTLELAPPAQAVLAVLLLRGPQTLGELRTRTERMHPFAELEEVAAVLEELAAAGHVEVVPRGPGQKEDRHAHRLGPAPTAGATAGAGATDEDTALDELRAELAARVAEVGELAARVAALTAEVERLRERTE